MQEVVRAALRLPVRNVFPRRSVARDFRPPQNVHIEQAFGFMLRRDRTGMFLEFGVIGRRGQDVERSELGPEFLCLRDFHVYIDCGEAFNRPSRFAFAL